MKLINPTWSCEEALGNQDQQQDTADFQLKSADKKLINLLAEPLCYSKKQKKKTKKRKNKKQRVIRNEETKKRNPTNLGYSR